MNDKLCTEYFLYKVTLLGKMSGQTSEIYISAHDMREALEVAELFAEDMFIITNIFYSNDVIYSRNPKIKLLRG